MLRLDIILQLVRAGRSTTCTVARRLQAIAVAVGGGTSGDGVAVGFSSMTGTSGGRCGYIPSSAAASAGVGGLRRDCIGSTTAVTVATGATRRGAEIFGVLARIGRVAGAADIVEASFCGEENGNIKLISYLSTIIASYSLCSTGSIKSTSE